MIWQRQLQAYFCLWQTELGRNRHYNMATPTANIFLFMTDRAGKKQTLQYGNANCKHISVYDRQSWEETDTTIWQRQLQTYFCLWQTELGRNRHYNMAMPTASMHQHGHTHNVINSCSFGAFESWKPCADFDNATPFSSSKTPRTKPLLCRSRHRNTQSVK